MSGQLTISYYPDSGKYKIYIKPKGLDNKPQYLGFIMKNNKPNLNNYYVHYLTHKLNNRLTLLQAVDSVILTILSDFNLTLIGIATNHETYWKIDYV